MGTIVLITLLLLASVMSVILSIAAKNRGWLFISSLACYFGAILVGTPPTLLSMLFWTLIAACVLALLTLRPVKWFWMYASAAMVVSIVILVVVLVSAFPKQGNTDVTTSSTSSTPASSSTSSSHTTWKMSEGDYGNNRWFTDGITEIKEAKTSKEAADATDVWLSRVKTDPNLLIGAVKFLLGEDGKDVSKADIETSDGWATDKAVQFVAEIQLLLTQSKITPGNAPSTGYNSGVENNTVVGATKPGISGNTKAVQITTPDGKVIWIMGRCGNIVTPKKPPVPPGKTDEHPIPPAPSSSTPSTPSPLKPKSDSVSDYQRPGTDSTTDAGTGTKPKVTASSSAESSPPKVTTSSANPQDETSTIAIGASSSPSSSSRLIPKPESGVNPVTSSGSTSSGINSGDPGNPFQ